MSARLIRAAARGLLCETSRTLIVEPALADLAMECRDLHWHSRARAYWSAWWALALACWHDLTWVHPEPTRAPSLARIMGPAGLLIAYHLALVAVALGFHHQGNAAAPPFLLQPWSHGVRTLVMVVGFGTAVAAVAWHAHVSQRG